MPVLLAVSIVIALLAWLWAADKSMILSDVKKELKEWLSDLEVSRDIAPPELKVHFQATVDRLKQTIRHHFDL